MNTYYVKLFKKMISFTFKKSQIENVLIKNINIINIIKNICCYYIKLI